MLIAPCEMNWSDEMTVIGWGVSISGVSVLVPAYWDAVTTMASLDSGADAESAALSLARAGWIDNNPATLARAKFFILVPFVQSAGPIHGLQDILNSNVLARCVFGR